MNMQDLTARSAEAAALLKAMSNPYRLRILCELQQGERSVTALEKTVGLSQSALSQHLAKLRSQRSSPRGERRRPSTIASQILVPSGSYV